MLDQTESACVIAGIAAMGAIYLAHSHSRVFSRHGVNPTECSARASTFSPGLPEPISARAATLTTTEEPVVSALEDSELWNNMSVEDEQAMKSSSVSLPNGGPNTEATKKARREVQPTLNLETTGAKTVGTRPLIAGRSGEETSTMKKPPKVTGECMFFMSDAYADQLMMTQSTM